jgi:hypothetical protein
VEYFPEEVSDLKEESNDDKEEGTVVLLQGFLLLAALPQRVGKEGGEDQKEKYVKFECALLFIRKVICGSIIILLGHDV